MKLTDLFEALGEYRDVEFRLERSGKPNVFNSEEVRQKFIELGDGQRGRPERIMRELQHMLSGTGVISLIEHIGDLTHRLADPVLIRSGRWNPDFAVPKVTNMLRSLKSYKFSRELFIEDITRNGADVERVLEWMERYAQAHARLRVYNAAQFHAREAAVAVGRLNFVECQKHLELLNRMIRGGSFVEIAAGFHPTKYR